MQIRAHDVRALAQQTHQMLAALRAVDDIANVDDVAALKERFGYLLHAVDILAGLVFASAEREIARENAVADAANVFQADFAR